MTWMFLDPVEDLRSHTFSICASGHANKGELLSNTILDKSPLQLAVKPRCCSMFWGLVGYDVKILAGEVTTECFALFFAT